MDETKVPKPRRPSRKALLLLGRFLFDVFGDVADGLQFFRVFIRHFDPKFFFKSHHQFDDVQ
jgi:hypothetical protein